MMSAATGTRLAAVACVSLAAVAGVAELVAVQAVLADAATTALLLHLGCASLVSMSVLVSVPRLRRADVSAAAGSLLFALCAPVIGAIAVVAVGLPSFRRAAARAQRTRVRQRAMPSFSLDALTSLGPSARVPRALAPARGLGQRGAPAEASGTASARRVELLRAMESVRAVPLLRRALRDPSEDVRLRAHTILVGRERRLRAAIERRQQRLVELTAGSDAQRARLHAELADQYWELCYAGFATSEGERSALQSAARHAELACDAKVDSAALVAVRAYLRLRDYQAAARVLERARSADVDAARLAPLLAELAFVTRRFGQVAGVLAALPPLLRQRPQIADLTRFWTQSPRASEKSRR